MVTSMGHLQISLIGRLLVTINGMQCLIGSVDLASSHSRVNTSNSELSEKNKL